LLKFLVNYRQKVPKKMNYSNKKSVSFLMNNLSYKIKLEVSWFKRPFNSRNEKTLQLVTACVSELTIMKTISKRLVPRQFPPLPNVLLENLLIVWFLVNFVNLAVILLLGKNSSWIDLNVRINVPKSWKFTMKPKRIILEMH